MEIREAIEKARKEINEKNLFEKALEMSKRYNILDEKFFDDTISQEENEEMTTILKVFKAICNDFHKEWNIGKFETMAERGEIK